MPDVPWEAGRLMAVPRGLRFEVFKRDGFRCRYCGRGPEAVLLEADHVVPEHDGGPTTIENLVTACADCNRGKGARSLTTAPAELDLAARAHDLEERAAQITAMLEAGAHLAAAHDELVDRLAGEWDARVGGDLDRASLSVFARHFSYEQLVAAMDITGSRRGLSWSARFRYFAGILRNWELGR